MSSRLSRFRRSAAALVLTSVVLAGLAVAAYGLVGTTTDPGGQAATPAVVRAPRRTAMLALRVIASHQNVTVGGAARYRVRILRACRPVRVCGRLHRFRAVRVWLRVVKPVPAGLTARFTRPVTRARRTTLVVDTQTTARSGSYQIRLRARSSRHPGRGRMASTLVTLTVKARPGPTFGVAGSPAGVLVPGGVAGIDLALTNLRQTDIVVSSVVVSVERVEAPRADATHPCTPADFAVSQLAGSYQLTLAPAATQTLGQLGIVASRWPSITMLDRPLNQDGCKGASVLLSYTGTATG